MSLPAYSVLAVERIPTPHIEYVKILPLLIVFGAALVGVLLEAFLPREKRMPAQVTLALGSLVAALIAVVRLAGTHSVTTEGAIAVDGPTLFIQGTIIAVSIGGILLMSERSLEPGGAFVAQASALPGSEAEATGVRTGRMQTEVIPLAMFSIGGMMLFPASNDLLTMFVALEVLSLPLYLLCGLARRRRLLSQEAALKYFLLGAFSSAFFVYGAALLYGYSGSFRLSEILHATSATGGNDALLFIGLAMLAVGLLFKLGGAPFHNWIPDVYQGAPTPITALMASGTKIAAFGALLRVFYVSFDGVRSDWRPMMWGVAILTMVVGAVIGITQSDVKRLLAYSSVAHAGFLLTALVATNRQGLSGSLFYLAAYGLMTIGAFAVVMLVRDASGEANHLSKWAGLGKRSPLVAGLFAFFLLALAGIPLTSGFTAKFAVFSAAMDGGAMPLVIVGVVTSAIAAFYYVKIIVLMFFAEPAPDGPTVVVPSAFTSAALAIGVAATVVLGIVPQPVLDLADKAVPFIR